MFLQFELAQTIETLRFSGQSDRNHGGTRRRLRLSFFHSLRTSLLVGRASCWKTVMVFR